MGIFHFFCVWTKLFKSSLVIAHEDQARDVDAR
uniref:Uncharacterized protein n=1 Tax=Siphoviridae sp. ctDcW16 TaxID=2826199 RepID=A0A8S5MU54_9CAUD|nr:MAG TPA: hypothetical protein [Siphoviridae sp. ctDcW16]